MVRLSYYDNVIQKTDKGMAPLLPPKPEAAPLPDNGADGAVPNGDAANNASLAERRRAAEMIALVTASISCVQAVHASAGLPANVCSYRDAEDGALPLQTDAAWASHTHRAAVADRLYDSSPTFI
jgi:hypothetical protein